MSCVPSEQPAEAGNDDEADLLIVEVNERAQLRICVAGAEIFAILTPEKAFKLGQDLIVASDHLAGEVDAATFALYITQSGNA